MLNFLQSSLNDAPAKSGRDLKPVNPMDVPIGENNMAAEEVKFSFGMIGKGQVRILIENNKKPGHLAVPDSIL